MAEGDEAAEAERKIQADRRQRQDRHTRGKRDVERLAEHLGREWQRQQQSRQGEVDHSFAQHRQPCAENRPLGRKARMRAMTM